MKKKPDIQIQNQYKNSTNPSKSTEFTDAYSQVIKTANLPYYTELRNTTQILKYGKKPQIFKYKIHTKKRYFLRQIIKIHLIYRTLLTSNQNGPHYSISQNQETKPRSPNMEKTQDTKIQNQHIKEIRSSTLILRFEPKIGELAN
uniref:Uncharacterized protein n=1 Tax=Opuntia streptacantha TaxID=393608 RepID=A0A7C9A3U6_OPUST